MDRKRVEGRQVQFAQRALERILYGPVRPGCWEYVHPLTTSPVQHIGFWRRSIYRRESDTIGMRRYELGQRRLSFRQLPGRYRGGGDALEDKYDGTALLRHLCIIRVPIIPVSGEDLRFLRVHYFAAIWFFCYVRFPQRSERVAGPGKTDHDPMHQARGIERACGHTEGNRDQVVCVNRRVYTRQLPATGQSATQCVDAG